MKVLFESGIIPKIKNGVKILGRGGNFIQSFGVPIYIEASDASKAAIESVQATGGKINVKYRTSLTMKFYLKRHKFAEYKNLKDPMPSPKKVRKLESLKRKGLEVEYPRAPWFTDNVEAIAKQKEEKQKRIDTG